MNVNYVKEYNASSILGHPPATSAHLPQCFVALAIAAARPEWSSLQDIDVPLRQCVLSRVIDEASFNSLIDSAPDTHLRALALSSDIPHAGDWLNVVPSSALSLHLLDSEFRPCLQYWLGLLIFTEGGRCPVCKALADPFGDHHVGCGGNGDRIHQHNSIQDAIFSAAQTAALAPRRELPSLIPGSQARPADIFLPNWDRGRPTALAVTVISTLQQLTFQGLPLHRVMPWLSGRTGKCLCMLHNARLWEYPSSHLSSSPLGAGAILL